MAFVKIEETEDHQAEPFVRTRHDPFSGTTRVTSTRVLGHTTWRCSFCRALAVTLHGDEPGKCGKCKL